MISRCKPPDPQHHGMVTPPYLPSLPSIGASQKCVHAVNHSSMGFQNRFAKRDGNFDKFNLDGADNACLTLYLANRTVSSSASWLPLNTESSGSLTYLFSIASKSCICSLSYASQAAKIRRCQCKHCGIYADGLHVFV
jgi:hypothetical protein